METETINGRPTERIMLNGHIVEPQYLKDFAPFETDVVQQGDTTISFSRYNSNNVDPVGIKMTVATASSGSINIANNMATLTGTVTQQNIAEYEALDLWANRYVATYVKLYEPMV